MYLNSGKWLGTIKVLRQQRLGSENGNFCWFTILFMPTKVGGWAWKSQKHADVILEWSPRYSFSKHFLILKSCFLDGIFQEMLVHNILQNANATKCNIVLISTIRFDGKFSMHVIWTLTNLFNHSMNFVKMHWLVCRI